MSTLRNCIACGDPLRGRSDKKFCNDYCRNAHHNQTKAKVSPPVRTINSLLGKNWRILNSLFTEPSRRRLRTSRDKLSDMGFLFNYITHSRQTTNGATYFFCYDYAYKPLGKDAILVLKPKSQEPPDALQKKEVDRQWS